MNELQRMQYLDAMGVDMFVPRFILPNALAPRQASLPAGAAVPVEAPAVVEADEARVLPERAAVVNRLVNLDFKEEKRGRDIPQPVEEKAVPIAEAEKAKPEESARFSLALWRIDNDLLVVDSRRPKAALPTETLLANILFQLNVLRQPLPRAEFLNWPMPGTVSDGGWDAAREMVQAFLEGRLSAQPVRHLLIMGNEAGRAILQQDINAQSGLRVTVEAFAAEALLLPSLADILYRPELKKAVWQNLHTFFNPPFTNTL